MYAPTYLYMLTQHYFFLCSKHSLPRVRRIMLGIRKESSPHKEGDTLFNARATFFFVQQKILAKKASTCRPRIQAWLLNNYCSLDCCTYIQVCDAPKKNAGQKKGRGCLQTKCRGNSCHAFFGKANSTVRARASETGLGRRLFTFFPHGELLGPTKSCASKKIHLWPEILLFPVENSCYLAKKPSLVFLLQFLVTGHRNNKLKRGTKIWLRGK